MLIEYKIKFEKDGLTIAQRIEPTSASRNGGGGYRAGINSLPAARHEMKTPALKNPLTNVPDIATGPGDETTGPGDETTCPGDETTGSGGLGSAPIFILGPIVFGNAHGEDNESKELPQSDGSPKARGTAAGK